MDNKISIETYKDYAKLRKAIGKVQKSGKNPHFKNTFVELNTAIDVVEEHIENCGFICFVQTPVNIEGKNYLNTKFVHNSGECIEGSLELVVTKQDPQMLGSSLTYARRYCLLTILGLQAVDDDGETGAGRGEVEARNKAKAEADKKKLELANKLNACKTEAEIDTILNSLDAKQKTAKLMGYANTLKAKLGENNGS